MSAGVGSTHTHIHANSTTAEQSDELLNSDDDDTDEVETPASEHMLVGILDSVSAHDRSLTTLTICSKCLNIRRRERESLVTTL